ncbi:hypothetical protein [Actinoplanes xinjiangensis]|uniref:hypothetical protein n=1 Tax=Actinoplanes xinjiangensis TaxID=512350 RepID=UPI003435220A
MTTGRGSALLRSLPVFVALVLTLFAPAPGTVAASSGPVIASCARTEPVVRTAEVASAPVEPDADPPAAISPAADRAPALTSQDTARAAVSRAPPPAV